MIMSAERYVDEAATGLRTLYLHEFLQEGRRRFGKNPQVWPLQCPGCRQTMTADDYAREHAPSHVIGSCCIGNFVDGKGCSLVLGGPHAPHTLEIIGEKGNHVPHFDFPPEE